MPDSPTSSSPPPPTRSGALAGLFVLALLYTLHFAAAVVVPVLLAALLALLLAPLSGRLRRWRVPAPLAALLVTALFAGGAGWGVQALAEPAAEWLTRAPQSLSQIEAKLRPVRKPVDEVRRATEQVEKLAGAAEDRKTVKVRSFDLGELFVVSASKLAAQTVVVVFLVYFLLASQDYFVAKVMEAAETGERRRRAIAVARRIQQDVGGYLGVMSLINLALGTVTALMCWAVALPNPALWGTLAALLNFIPYGGPFVTACVLAVAGLLSFDSAGRGLLPAGLYLIITTVESDLLTPMVVGRRLTLPPLLVFLSLLLWGWLWSVAGALLAVPILVVMKVAADHVEALKPLAPFLGAPRAAKRRSPFARTRGSS